MKERQTTLKKEMSASQKELRELESKITSVQPTVDCINKLLACYGYSGFKLEKATAGTSYKIVRLDGTEVKQTLSEGEKTFIAFLYFYHLLGGSNSENGTVIDRIAVFDDPVSSLDSDILFVVSSLIKHIFDDVRAGVGHVKQVFVLTHNVYFHKEVSFHKSNRKVCDDETFWVVKKNDGTSTFVKHPTNPIKTSYDLLWSEIRNPNRSNLTIQNTMRRILENYFKILGSADPDSLYHHFEGEEKLICRSLLSWVNDGSHFGSDDLFFSVDEVTVDKYLATFRSVFEKSGHAAHYRMMMGGSFVE
jgi:wobble nucleotide-excising tRNase